jgi:hypothetical protein
MPMLSMPLRWLTGTRDLEAGDRVLVVQSGSPAVFSRVVAALLERHRGVQIAALVGRGAEDAVTRRDGVEYIASRGASGTFVRELRARNFDHVMVLAAGDPGYWKMRVLPFALGARRIWAVNENLDYFPIDLRHAPVAAQHARRRLESSVTFAGEVHSVPVERVAKVALYPAVLGYLWTYERVRTLRARASGAPPWKRQNRPSRGRGGCLAP